MGDSHSKGRASARTQAGHRDRGNCRLLLVAGCDAQCSSTGQNVAGESRARGRLQRQRAATNPGLSMLRSPAGREIWHLLLFLGWFVCCWACPRSARAETLQAAIGSKAFTLSESRVACAPPGGGWAIEPSSQAHALRAPTTNEAIGKAVALRVANSLAQCGTESNTVVLVATARPPSIDASSVVLSLDQGKVEIHGSRLAGAAVAWRSN